MQRNILRMLAGWLLLDVQPNPHLKRIGVDDWRRHSFGAIRQDVDRGSDRMSSCAVCDLRGYNENMGSWQSVVCKSSSFLLCLVYFYVTLKITTNDNKYEIFCDPTRPPGNGQGALKTADAVNQKKKGNSRYLERV